MLFNSNTFLIFFCVVLVFHHLPASWPLKKINLLVASYLFYAAWNPPFVLLLVLSTLVDWVAARRISLATRPVIRRSWLLFSLLVNLGVLGFFKYSEFVLQSFVQLVGLVGVSYTPPQLDVILPVGISFYTFQTLSYTLDIYRRQAAPSLSLLDFALYVTFFPQLVAGPIVRATEFLPQCAQPRRATLDQFAWGAALIVLGLFEKTVVADSLLATPAQQLFDGAGPPGLGLAWIGTLAFTGQIFCDFAGYSACAIGVALCLGFTLPTNFRCPYAAIGFSDFWRRWHISLSGWLRDYLYISLGGNRRGGARTAFNLLLTMFLGGLWHGASWTFAAWGILHGLFLLAERGARRLFGHYACWQRWPGRLFLGALTFLLVAVAWVFFRAYSLPQSVAILAALCGLGGDGPAANPVHLGVTLLTLSAIVAFHVTLRDTTLEQAASRVPWPVRSVLLAGMLLAIVLTPGEDRAFIYFQF